MTEKRKEIKGVKYTWEDGSVAATSPERRAQLRLIDKKSYPQTNRWRRGGINPITGFSEPYIGLEKNGQLIYRQDIRAALGMEDPYIPAPIPVVGLGPTISLRSQGRVTTLGDGKKYGERPMGSKAAKDKRQEAGRIRLQAITSGKIALSSDGEDVFMPGGDFAFEDICGDIKATAYDVLTPAQSEKIRWCAEHSKRYLVLFDAGHRFIHPEHLKPSGHSILVEV